MTTLFARRPRRAALLAAAAAIACLFVSPPGALRAEEPFDLAAAVEALQQQGLMITADRRTIEEAASEAAYFMFAERKQHQPQCEPFALPEEGDWLAGKPVFRANAQKEEIRAGFERLVRAMGYDRVCIYRADLHYGVANYARFTLYRLTYEDADRRAGREVMLGDAHYVINLP